MTLTAIKYRVYPTPEQEELLTKTFGCVRVLWNHYARIFNSYDKVTNPKLKYPTVKEMKQSHQYMEEVSYNALAQKVRDFWQFKNQYFKKDRKIKIGRAKIKGRGNHDSFRLEINNGFRVKGDKLYLAKMKKEVKIKGSKPLSSLTNIRNVTISRTPDGKIYASVLYDEVKAPLPLTGKQVGIDLGLYDLITTSDGDKIPNPNFHKKMDLKIKRLHQVLSKKKKGSKRRNRTRIKLARRYQKLRNQRNHLAHKISIDLVRKYDLICAEDLNVSGMVKLHTLARSIQNAAWTSIINKIKYKCDWYGKTFYQIDRFFPSSKKCSVCGTNTTGMNLDKRDWTCDSCHSHHDRDINAAKNILAEGKRITGL